MSDSDTTGFPYDKNQYTEGDQITLTLNGTIVRVSDVVINDVVDMTLPDGANVHTERTGVTLTNAYRKDMAPVISKVTDPPRTWTVAGNGKSAVAVAALGGGQPEVELLLSDGTKVTKTLPAPNIVAKPVIPPPSSNMLLDVDFSAGQGSISGTTVKAGSTNLFQLYDNAYGSGNKQKEYQKPDSWSIRPGDGLVVKQSYSPNVAPGYNWKSGFAGSREVGFYLPMFVTVDVEAKLPRFAETWPAIWYRHTSGSGTAEIDDMEGFMAQQGDILSSTLHYMGNVFGINGHRNRFQIPLDNAFHKYTLIITPSGTKGMDLAFRIDGKPATASYSSQFYGNKIDFHVDDISYLKSKTPDLLKCWDLAINVAIGGNWVADPDKPYTGTLQNGQKGMPLGPTCVSWRNISPPQQSEMVIRSIRATSNM